MTVPPAKAGEQPRKRSLQRATLAPRACVPGREWDKDILSEIVIKVKCTRIMIWLYAQVFLAIDQRILD